MNRVFVDTSAIVALINPLDEEHSRAVELFDRLAAAGSCLGSTSYVLVETYALLVRRLGIDAARAFREDFEPLLELVWVEADLHNSGLDLLLDRGNRRLSLVDAVSFLAIGRQEIDLVFAFDQDFDREGFAGV